MARLRKWPFASRVEEGVHPESGKMSFVPEGQADRSQARSAWVIDAESPVPGRPKSLSVPEWREVKEHLRRP
jgi:hypothetical protein